MKARRRGHDTKTRLLQSACEVFAEAGYRDATHAEICKRAGANVAAINYYFASKDLLYRAAFKHLSQKADRLYPLDGGLASGTAPELRLRAFIHALLSRMFDHDQIGGLHRIRMAEMFDSTGILNDDLARRLTLDRNHILAILREIMTAKASQHDVEWCEMSIVGQCFSAAPGPPGGGEGPRAIFGLDGAAVDSLTDHIFTFSLAGIQAITRTRAPRATGSRKAQAKTKSAGNNHDAT